MYWSTFSYWKVQIGSSQPKPREVELWQMAQLSSIMGVPAATSRIGEAYEDTVAVIDRAWDSQVLVWQQETITTGTYGVGMNVDVPMGSKGSRSIERPFAVSKLTALKDPMGNGSHPAGHCHDTTICCLPVDG